MENNIQIKIVTPINKTCNCLICPYCGAHELVDCTEKDVNKWRFNIRAFRVDNYSHCIKCNRWF